MANIANQILAISNIDYYTAKHLLSEDINHYIGNDSAAFEIPENSTVLVQSWALLSHLRDHIGTTTLAIVCMPEAVASLMHIPILDHVKHVNTIPSIDFDLLWDLQDSRPTETGLLIPLVNIGKMIIADEVATLKREQIMSHALTFYYAVPRSSRDEVQKNLLSWLAGDLATEQFYKIYKNRWTKSGPCLELLHNFMKTPKGIEYVDYFSRFLKDKPVGKTSIPSFEIIYFSKLKDRLETA